MKTLGRRVSVLESAPGPMSRFHAMTDEQLIAECARLKAAIERCGILFPEGFDAMHWCEQEAWLRQQREQIECEA